MQDEIRINPKHKDRLFRRIFHTKEDLLSLYNAVDNSDYSNAEDLEIYTMEDFVYMGMKNDLSFLINMTLNIFEHQSTYNPNMPLRGLFYISSALQKYVAQNHLDLYSSTLLSLPLPQYYVFYNGTKEMPDETPLLLTDSMNFPDAAKKSSAQITAHMVNINAGHSDGFMKKCPKLYQYSLFIAEIRGNQEKKLSLKEAVEEAVETCIQKGILTDILLGNKAEVTDMILQEYDENLHISNEKEISYNEGVKAGMEEGQRQAQDKILKADQRANEADQRASDADQRIRILTLLLQKKSEKEIAEILNLPLETVLEVVQSVSLSK